MNQNTLLILAACVAAYFILNKPKPLQANTVGNYSPPPPPQNYGPPGGWTQPPAAVDNTARDWAMGIQAGVSIFGDIANAFSDS